MIRVDPKHWTADFRIARAVAESYAASGLDDVLFVCVGDPQDAIGRLAPTVGEETRKYHPSVWGTLEQPLNPSDFSGCVDRLEEAGRDRFIVAIEAGYARAEHLGSIEITDRPLTSVVYDPGAAWVCDLTVNVALRLRAGSLQDARDDGRPSGARAERRARGLREAAREVSSDDDAGGPGPRKKFTPVRPDEIDANLIGRLADTVIDGNLRFLSKVGKQRL